MKTKLPFPTIPIIFLVINIVMIYLFSFLTYESIVKGEAFCAALWTVFVIGYINLTKDRLNTIRLHFILNRMSKLSEDDATKYLIDHPKSKNFMEKMVKDLKKNNPIENNEDEISSN